MRAGLRLLIDNQPDMHVIGEAGDGLQAIDQAAALQPDVVLLDLGLPGMDGCEVARRLVQWAEGRPLEKRPLLVAVTGRGEESDRVLGLELGADE